MANVTKFTFLDPILKNHTSIRIQYSSRNYWLVILNSSANQNSSLTMLSLILLSYRNVTKFTFPAPTLLYNFDTIKNGHGFLYFLYKSIPTIIRNFDMKENLSNLCND